MPTVKVPLPSYKEFKKLSTPEIVRDLKRRAELFVESKRVATAIENINTRLYPKIRKALPDGVKSFDVDGFMFSAYQGEARSSLSVEKLLQQTVRCPCGCGHQFPIPASVVEKSKVEGAVPKPTLSVREAKSGSNGGDE